MIKKDSPAAKFIAAIKEIPGEKTVIVDSPGTPRSIYKIDKNAGYVQDILISARLSYVFQHEGDIMIKVGENKERKFKIH